MGTSESTSESLSINEQCEKQLIQKLHYIESRTLPRFGKIQIYRFKQPPYDYIMKYVRCFNKDDPKYNGFREMLKKINKDFTHKNIAQMHCLSLQHQFHMCVKNITVQTYCNYYAFTLKQLIEQRRKDDIRFTSNQVFYVAKNLLQISSFLHQKDMTFGGYQSEQITLSAEGYIKLYLFHLQEGNKHNSYFKALNDRHNIREYLPLPPQYLDSLEQGKFNVQFNIEKEDSFYIGMILMEMLVQQNLSNYYSMSGEKMCNYKLSSVWKDLGILKYVYPKELIHLLQKLLEQNPEKRFTVKAALNYLTQKRENISVGGSLRMFEDQDHQIRPKVSYRTSLDYQSSVLKIIQPNILENKLTVMPIKTLTKGHKTNNNLGVSLTTSKHSTSTKSKSSFTRNPRSSSLTYGPKNKN